MGPMAKAIVITEIPKAKLTPRSPIPTPGKAAAKTALPQPPKTNHAVSVGLCVSGRFSSKELIPYIASQVLGASFGALLLYVIASGNASFSLHGGFAANGYGAHSPGGYSMFSVFVCEVVMTFFFLMVILGATSKKASNSFAPLAIGLSLTLIHLVSIPVSNTSVNPARSFSQAIFVQDWALAQLWLFCLAPLIGAVLAGLLFPKMISKD